MAQQVNYLLFISIGFTNISTRVQENKLANPKFMCNTLENATIFLRSVQRKTVELTINKLTTTGFTAIN